MTYFNNVVCQQQYELRTDYTIKVLMYNFIASVKSYLNRKQKRINLVVPNKYKKSINFICKKFWKAKRNETSLDKLIILRDIFEHEEISKISLNITFWNDHIDYQLRYEDLDLIEICTKSIGELDSMNNEIETLVETELSKLNLRDNTLFLNSFYKKFKAEEYAVLMPEATKEETKHFDELIECLVAKTGFNK
jgi:hypothetical protein